MTFLDFSDRSTVAGRALEQLTNTGYWFDDREIPRAFGRALQAPAGDLISIATACYAADRIVRRRARTGGMRHLQVRIAVEEHERWTRARVELERYLNALTGDNWLMWFVPGRPLRVSESQLQLLPDGHEGDCVALFSGGLDSLAGAAKWLGDNPHARLFLVGARSSWVVGRDQTRLVALLRQWAGDRLHYVGVPVQLRNARGGESSQRARAFLFAALGLATAHTAGSQRVLVFENGYGAINPRLGEHQVRHQVNRGAHPRVLDGLRDTLTALGFHIQLELTHLYETKAEVLRALPDPMVAAISLSASCDSYPLRSSRGSHCGGCGSCLLRRQSLLAAGLSRHDRRDYVVDWHRPDARIPTARLMARQAWLLADHARPERWSTVRRLWPEIAASCTDPDSLDGHLLLGMFRRYGREWQVIGRSHSYIRRLREPAQAAGVAA